MSAQDPFTSTADPTAGVSFPDPTSLGNIGLPPWLIAILTNPTQPGTPVGSTPATGTTGAASNPSSGFNWASLLGPAATIGGALLNSQAQSARNNLLQQQISSNNAIAQADQSRRDYYASILMPSILQGLRNNNPKTLAAVQGQQAQAMHFPAPLTFSGTGITTPAATTTAATPVSSASALTQGASPVGVGSIGNSPSGPSTTGTTFYNNAQAGVTGNPSWQLYNPRQNPDEI